MTARRIVLTGLVAGLVASVLPAQAGAGEGRTCRHLIVGPASGADHFGNTAPYPSEVDNPDQGNLRWAEVRTTRTQLIATIAVKQLSEGGGTLDHGYSMTFRTGGQSIEVMAMFGQ